LTVRLPEVIDDVTEVRLFDISGREYHCALKKSADSRSLQIDIRELDKGVYLIKYLNQFTLLAK
jgi:hypothetical protein